MLHPKWEKSYYRCAEAWHKLGEISRARDINEHGRLLCSASTELQSQMNHLKASETVRFDKHGHAPMISSCECNF